MGGEKNKKLEGVWLHHGITPAWAGKSLRKAYRGKLR